MTVVDLIELLETYPDNTEVLVIAGNDSEPYDITSLLSDHDTLYLQVN